jgi:hypothetical protein
MMSQRGRRVLTVIWSGIVVLVVVIGVVNTTRMGQWRYAYQLAMIERDGLKEVFKLHKSNEYSLVGRRVVWPPLEEVTGRCAKMPESCVQKRMVVLSIDSLACDLCAQDVTWVGREVSRSSEGSRVAVVIGSSDVRYVRAFVRANQVEWPVYVDPDGAFGKANSIPASPMAVLIDDQGRVSAAEQPINGSRELMAPFVQLSRRVVNGPAALTDIQKASER